MSIKEVLIKSPRPRPTLSLDDKELPEIKKWKVGEKHCIVLEVEQTSSRKDDEYDNDKCLHATFKVLKATEDDDRNGD